MEYLILYRTAVYEDYFLTKMTSQEMGNVHLQIRKIIDESLTWEAVEWMKRYHHRLMNYNFK